MGEQRFGDLVQILEFYKRHILDCSTLSVPLVSDCCAIMSSRPQTVFTSALGVEVLDFILTLNLQPMEGQAQNGVLCKDFYCTVKALFNFNAKVCCCGVGYCAWCSDLTML